MKMFERSKRPLSKEISEVEASRKQLEAKVLDIKAVLAKLAARSAEARKTEFPNTFMDRDDPVKKQKNWNF